MLLSATCLAMPRSWASRSVWVLPGSLGWSMVSCLITWHFVVHSGETTTYKASVRSLIVTLSYGDSQFSPRVIFRDAIVVLLSPMVLIVISCAHILASIISRTSFSGRGETFSTRASHLTVVISFYTSAMILTKTILSPSSTPSSPPCANSPSTVLKQGNEGAMVKAFERTNLAQAESV